MAIRFNKRKNKLLALLMAMMMTSSFAALAACDTTDDDPSDDSTTTTPTQTDSSRINNGSFEFVDWNNGKNLLITSPTGWTKSAYSASSGTAVASKAASGILNTDVDAWENLTQSALQAEGIAAPETEEDAAKYWSKMSAYDKLKFYKAWEDGNYDKKVSELDFYEADKDNFNLGIGDVPVNKDGNIIDNPGTHPQEGEDKDTNVLMIHNTYTDGQGTAQKYTSSSTITLESGTSAKISVWVKTSNLTYFSSGTGKQEEVVADKGAYIGITHTVGSKTLDQMQVKNINTEKMEGTDNGWVQYTFYLQGCSFSTSTFTMVLGLGQSGGTNRLEYVEGYAFFDDVECEIISNEDYDKGVDNSFPEITLGTPADEKIFQADDNDQRKYALNLNLPSSDDTSVSKSNSLPDMKVGLTEEKKGSYTYVAGDISEDDGKLPDGYKVEPKLNFTKQELANDVNGVYPLSDWAGMTGNNRYLKAALTNGFGYEYDETTQTSSFTKFPFADTTETLLILSASGANYTAKFANEKNFTLDDDQRMIISFYVKTSNMEGFTGANVNVRHNGGILSSISTIDTTNVIAVDVDSEKDIYKGWQQCFLFVENDTEADGLTFTVEFSYGGATVFGASRDSFIDGWAAFTGFEIIKGEKDEMEAYDYASDTTYSKVLSLVDPDKPQYSSSEFDSPAYLTGEKDIETGYANPRNYIGVVGDSAYVSGTPNKDITNDKYSSKTAGLISKKYIDAYAENGSIMGIQGKDEDGLKKAKEELETLFGNATQPLLIYNEYKVYNEKKASYEDVEPYSYGFISTNPTTISSYQEISVRVKVSKDATAYVYLIDMDDDSRESALSIGRRISYWYDKDGNVCKVDPTSDDFNKKTDIVLELQSNGLYTLKGQAGYYANLQAYPQYAEKNGNLLVAEGGVEYAYTNAWNGVGVDGVAFYYADGKYYADPAKTIEVKDFSEVPESFKLAPRYEAVEGKNAKDLVVSVGDTNGEWKTITFYIGADSDSAKNYRLEVWSGTRDGKEPNPAGSYVMFDSCSTSTLEEASYNTLAQNAFDYLMETNNYKDEEDLKKNYKDLMYNAYSFYDDAKFLRYDSSLDENNVGNKYDDYDPTASTYAEVLSFLRYENTVYNNIYVFANFTQNEKTVPVDVDPEEDTDNSTEEEETPEADLDWGLLISSLAVAGVLVAVLIIIGVRKAVKWSKKKAAALSRPRRKFAKAKKEKPVAETETKDEE